MYFHAGGPEEDIQCPSCGRKSSHNPETSAFGGSVKSFQCECGVKLRFTKRSEQLLVAVVYLLLAVVLLIGLAAFFGKGNVATIIAIVGVISVLGLLLYQGSVPRVEIDT